MKAFAMWLSVVPLFLSALVASVSASGPTRTVGKRQSGVNPNFVTSSDGQFHFNGSVFKFIGTNAYWLPTLNTEQDIADTFANISALGIKVVRVWAFNDVDEIPVNGTWFQLIANGTTTVNTGPNGLQKLDTVVRLAEKAGIHVLLSLTNNWNPRPLLDNITAGINGIGARDVTKGTNNSLPRNFLSNDYGGMDTYVREFGNTRHHDEFFVNETIINIFKNWTTQVVSRYVNSPAIFSWEIANDSRCNSSLPATSNCNAQTVTKWHSTISQHIRSIDPNHLITSGTQGFFCVDCPKLFPRVTPPPPQTSATPGRKKKRRVPKPLTAARILRERAESRKRSLAIKRKAGLVEEGGVRIRGMWKASATRRQDEGGIGSAFDGTQGVDSEDILNIPEIGFLTFQLFPDQNNYGPDDPNLSAFNSTLRNGLDWIQRHAELGQIFNKPVALTGFGLVTQNNTQSFVPFNDTVAPFASDQGAPTAPNTQQPFVNDQQRDDAYNQWLGEGIKQGLNGIIQYQWGQGNLTTSPGTTISPAQTTTGESTNQDQTGLSPNDGYTTAGSDQDAVQAALSNAADAIAPDA